jgi:hypothetical protein
MFRNKQQQPDPAKDAIAEVLASKIIRWQSGLATVLNKWFDHYSKKQQQWLLVIFCTLTVAGLIVCLIAPYGKMAMKRIPANNYWFSFRKAGTTKANRFYNPKKIILWKINSKPGLHRHILKRF